MRAMIVLSCILSYGCCSVGEMSSSKNKTKVEQKMLDIFIGDSEEEVRKVAGDAVVSLTRFQIMEFGAMKDVSVSVPCDVVWYYPVGSVKWYEVWFTDGKVVHVLGPVSGDIKIKQEAAKATANIPEPD